MGMIQLTRERDPEVVELVEAFNEVMQNSDKRQIATEVARLASRLIQMLEDGPDLIEGLQFLLRARARFLGQLAMDAEARGDARLP
jgi:hypothetical protein